MGSLLCEEFGPQADDDDKNDDHRSFKFSDERVMNERGLRGGSRKRIEPSEHGSDNIDMCRNRYQHRSSFHGNVGQNFAGYLRTGTSYAIHSGFSQSII